MFSLISRVGGPNGGGWIGSLGELAPPADAAGMRSGDLRGGPDPL